MNQKVRDISERVMLQLARVEKPHDGSKREQENVFRELCKDVIQAAILEYAEDIEVSRAMVLRELADGQKDLKIQRTQVMEWPGREDYVFRISAPISALIRAEEVWLFSHLPAEEEVL